MYKKIKDLNWRPPTGWEKISTIDMHTGGEPLRISDRRVSEIDG